MRISARLQITPAADRRDWQRRRLSLDSSLQSTGEDVTIHDISASGMLIETAAELAVFDALEIELPETGITPALVIWNSGRYFGCEFKQHLSQGAISAALLRSLPAAPAELELPLPLWESLPEESTSDEFRSEDLPEERKAPFGVRLRVIFGSALLLWALIIWAAVSLYKLIQWNLR
jgi:PilZ domain-containing protein